MSKSSERRISKYEKKISGDLAKERYDSEKKEMVRLERKYFAEAVDIELKIKGMLSNVGSLAIIYYIIFAKELIKIIKTHSSSTQLKEAEILQEKWKRRGLNSENLIKIKQLLIPSYTPVICEVAKFDVGKFDVNCFG